MISNHFARSVTCLSMLAVSLGISGCFDREAPTPAATPGALGQPAPGYLYSLNDVQEMGRQAAVKRDQAEQERKLAAADRAAAADERAAAAAERKAASESKPADKPAAVAVATEAASAPVTGPTPASPEPAPVVEPVKSIEVAEPAIATPKELPPSVELPLPENK